MLDAFDVNRGLKGTLTLSPTESDDERRARLAREEREHNWELSKEKIIFGLVVFSYMTMLLTCLFVILRSEHATDSPQTRLAWIGVTALISGLVSSFAGYAVGSRKK
jgi:hypothetical protein